MAKDDRKFIPTTGTKCDKCGKFNPAVMLSNICCICGDCLQVMRSFVPENPIREQCRFIMNVGHGLERGFFVSAAIRAGTIPDPGDPGHKIPVSLRTYQTRGHFADARRALDVGEYPLEMTPQLSVLFEFISNSITDLLRNDAVNICVDISEFASRIKGESADLLIGDDLE